MNRIDRRVGRRIAETRRLLGLTQAELAERVGLAVETLSRLENGAAMTSLPRLYAVAAALEVDLHELVRLRKGNSTKDRALERLVWLASRQTEEDIELLLSIGARIFQYLRQSGGSP